MRKFALIFTASVAVLLLTVGAVFGYKLFNASLPRDEALVHISADDRARLRTEFSARNQAATAAGGSTVDISFTSAELLTLVSEALPASEVSDLGARIEVGQARLQLSSNLLGRKLYPSAVLMTASDSKSLMVQEFSTGNPMLDQLTAGNLEAQRLQLETSLNNGLRAVPQGELQTISLQDNLIVLTFSK